MLGAAVGFKKQPKGFATKAIHVGQSPEQWNSLCVVPPICTSTTFLLDGPGESRGFDYGRYGNPTRNVLEKCLAALDNGKYALTFSSGVGAATAVMTLLSHGDHIVVGDDIYGGTTHLIRKITSRMGITATFADPNNLEEFSKAIGPKTKLVWIETPTNPLLKVVDIRAVSDVVHKAGDIIFVVDNTFLTSYFQRPLELGADMVCYSMTKFMNGHNDVIMGAATMSSETLYERLLFVQQVSGGIPSPFDCYEANRSLKTLALRMEQHQENSIACAQFLEQHPLVEKVLHPALPSHPNHELALKQTYGSSGIFAFYIKGNLENAKAFLKALKIFQLAKSLGGCESLAGVPAIMSHEALPEEERISLGITDNLIRVSVGLEDPADLIEDLKNALEISQKV